MQLTPRDVNLVGAWALDAARAMREATDREVGGSGSLAAGIVTIALFPGERVDSLRRALGLSPSGVVRTLDQLVAAGLVERKPGAEDGREVLVHPTRSGIRTAARARHLCRLCDHPACEQSWCPVSAGAPGYGKHSHPAESFRMRT